MSAKITKGTRLGRRARWAVRWGTIVLGLAILMITALSWYYTAWVRCEISTSSRWSNISVCMQSGRLRLFVTPQRMSCWGGPPDHSTLRYYFYKTGGRYSAISTKRTNPVAGHQKIWSTEGTEYEYYLSGFIPGLLIGGIGMVTWYRHRRSRLVGGCTNCGYSLDGLTSDVCPECGETHEA